MNCCYSGDIMETLKDIHKEIVIGLEKALSP